MACQSKFRNVEFPRGTFVGPKQVDQNLRTGELTRIHESTRRSAMHRLTPWAASRLALIVIPAIVAGCNRPPSADPPPLVDAGTLKQTEVLPYTQGVLRPDKNYVYCATFQIAWDQMQELLVGKFELEGDPPLAVALDREHFDK